MSYRPMSIPKTLHYCWFGKGEKPENFNKCLESWKLYCPDFKIIEWNESNAPTKNQPFYKNALRKKKYAFVADTVRAQVLFEQGGIYLDTDMLLLKPIEGLLQYDFFIGEEVKDRIAFGLFGAVPKHRFLKAMVHFYENTEFDCFNPPVITHTFKSFINKSTIEKEELIVSPEYFYPVPFQNKDEDFSKFTTDASYAVHLWDHSWKESKMDTKWGLFKKIVTVHSDFLYFGYSKKYYKRYAKEFSRKFYHKVIAKNQE